jgi:hypothetical protein
VTKNADAFNIESAHAETKTIRCVQDQNSGTGFGQALFEIRGQNLGRDLIGRTASGINVPIAAVTADDGLLQNAGFRSFGGTAAAPTSITDWTSSVTVNSTNYSFDSANYFRRLPSDGTTSYALNVKVTANLTQQLTVQGSELRTDVPYFLAVVWNRAVGSASGTLTLRMGAVNEAIAVAAQTGWVVSLVPATSGSTNWYQNFKENDLDIAIEWARTGGSILIGEVIFLPLTEADSTFWSILPASAASYTDWAYQDEKTAADTIASDSINQRRFAEDFGEYLPHATGSAITWADPT